MIILREAKNMFKRSLKVKLKGFRQYSGNDIEICQKIVRDCWNGKYFQVSSGHFTAFYIRDFSWVIESLIRLGYREEVKKTLEYALETYSRYNKVTVAINDKGKPFDFPNIAVDSLPSLVRSLLILKDPELIKKNKDFIAKEAKKLFVEALDDGIVTPHKYFSSIKDHSKRKSSCYDNCMIAMLANDLKQLNISEIFSEYDFKKNIKEKFWTVSYFKDDLHNFSVTGDSNIFPFWTGLFTEKPILKKALNSIRKEDLEKPFPLKYHQKYAQSIMSVYDKLVPDYETDSVWAHLGLIFIDVYSGINQKLAAKYFQKYKEKIEEFKTFLEVYDRDGKPFISKLYVTDEGMIWAAKYLDLRKRLKL